MAPTCKLLPCVFLKWVDSTIDTFMYVIAVVERCSGVIPPPFKNHRQFSWINSQLEKLVTEETQ